MVGVLTKGAWDSHKRVTPKNLPWDSHTKNKFFKNMFLVLSPTYIPKIRSCWEDSFQLLPSFKPRQNAPPIRSFGASDIKSRKWMCRILYLTKWTCSFEPCLLQWKEHEGLLKNQRWEPETIFPLQKGRVPLGVSATTLSTYHQPLLRNSGRGIGFFSSTSQPRHSLAFPLSHFPSSGFNDVAS